MDGQTWIASRDSAPVWQTQRSLRSWPQATITQLGSWQAGHWVMAGCWSLRSTTPVLPEIPDRVLLVGALLAEDNLPHPTAEWQTLLRREGGLIRSVAELPSCLSLWLTPLAAAELQGESLPALVASAVNQGWRVIRQAALDVAFDPRPRVLQVITSLQRGGAERLVLDLHLELPRHGMGSSLLTLGSPTRTPFPTPPGTHSFHLPPEPALRSATVLQLVSQTGSDLVHAHLLDGKTTAQIAAAVPCATTFHNLRQGWPEAWENLRETPQTLLLGCASAVTQELQTAFPTHTCRTIWNGIRPMSHRKAKREQSSALTLIAVANPRPQKRLPLLIEVLAHLPGARLQIAGEPSAIHPDAHAEVRRCEELVQTYGLQARVEWLGALENIPAALAAADVFVSTSAHEGLSLAQLEALDAGLPVVTTAVGGAAEVAAQHPSCMRLVPLDARPHEFAQVILDLMQQHRPQKLAADFTVRVMAERHAWLFRSWLSRSPHTPQGVWLLTNNFSTGGAQSSARRLLLQWQKEGLPVHAATLQEDPNDPTPGMRALLTAGVPVLPLPEGDAATALTPLLDHLQQAPPKALLFWNVIPEHKILLAEALHGVPVFDVSPGEMLFASLQRYLANSRPGNPVRSAAAYGALLSGVVVKHEVEVAHAEHLLMRSAVCIPNGVPCRAPQPEAPTAHLTLGTAARLHPHKRLEDLLDAFRHVHQQLPQARLRIAGGPDAGQEAYAEELRNRSADLPVEWCGEVSDLAAFHDSLCLFAMISEPSGCPNASLEAMASSLPLVATAVGGACQQVVHGMTGFLTPPREPVPMANALLQLLIDHELRARMRAAAHARALAHYSLERMAADYRRACLGG